VFDGSATLLYLLCNTITFTALEGLLSQLTQCCTKYTGLWMCYICHYQ